jgi:chemotaxis signal transduction protein
MAWPVNCTLQRDRRDEKVYLLADEKQSESSTQPATAGKRGDDDPYNPGVQGSFLERQYCVFRAGRERFCLSVLEMEEVVDWPQVTPVPRAPAFLMGIFNLRGAIIPIIDIAFSEGRRPDLLPRHVVVAVLEQGPGHNAMRLGIAADEVIGTFSSTEALEANQAPREIAHCCGLLRHEENRLALALDLKGLVESFSVGAV